MTDAEIAALLEKAAEFPDEDWTQGCYAQDSQGDPVPWEAPEAVKHCAAGMLFKTAADHRPEDNPYGTGAPLYYEVNESLLGQGTLHTWNDHPDRKPEQVRRLFRKTAARLREQDTK